ncbi:MAG: zinc ABC transporter substrate-binding protein [Endomicrobiales bacterium]|nr:zinc ABC transporter substrate-binding protein [Endomicrobiales bacterium]
MRSNLKAKIFLLSYVLFSFIQSAPANVYGKLKVVVTNTHVGEIVRAIAKNSANVVTLIPGGACPGHFDIDPKTVRKIADGDVFISQVWEKRFDGVLEGINNRNLIKKRALTEGSWMVPEVNIKAAKEITMILTDINPDKTKEYRKNLKDYVDSIRIQEKRISKLCKRIKGYKVISAKHQQDFLKWMGLDVVASYERAEDLNMLNLAEVIGKAKKENVVLVVDNLQSGASTGLQIAGDLKMPHVTLTNFPKNKNYAETLYDNAQTVLESLK